MISRNELYNTINSMVLASLLKGAKLPQVTLVDILTLPCEYYH